MKNPLMHLVFALIALVIASGAYGVWFVMVDTENAKARSLASDIQTKSQDAARIAEAKAALAALTAKEDSISMHFISANDVVPFLGSLEQTGTALGSKVHVVSVGADNPKPGAQGHLTLSVQITGTFDAVLRTLGSLEYSPYYITLTNLTLDTAGENAWSAATTFSVGTGPAPATTTPAKAS